MTPPRPAQRPLLLLLVLCILGSPASLHSITLKFTSGATFEGEILGYSGTNTVVMANPKDGKHYAVALSSLDKDSRWAVATIRAMTPSFNVSGPWQKDATWLSNQQQIYTLKAKALLVERKRKALGDTAQLRKAANQNDAQEQRQIKDLSKELSDLNTRIAAYDARQREIEARHRLRELKQ